jgi:hypothetical protein
MIREEYLRRLIDASPIELYLSGSDGARIYWPWRMEPPKEASESYRNACEQYIIDSDPKDDSVSTRDVLDTAVSLDAEVASLADVYQDKDATVESILRGFEVADDHDFDGTLLVPLQQPYVECYREIGEPRDEWVGLGGLKKGSDHARVTAARRFRESVGTDVHVHGFGWGPTEGIAAAIRQTPSILDSLDYSTPVRDVPVDATPGDEVMSVQAAYAGARLVRDLRECVPGLTDENVREIQAGVGEF